MDPLTYAVAARFAALRSPSPLSWSGNEATFEAPNKSGGQVEFVVEFKSKMIRHPEYDSVQGYDVGFMRVGDRGTPWQYKLTKDPGVSPFHVFGGVLEAVRQFLKLRKPDILWFVADEPDRARLYNRLLRRMKTPAGFVVEVTGDGKYTMVNEKFKAQRELEVGEDSPRKQEERSARQTREVLLSIAHDWVNEAIEDDLDLGDVSDDKVMSELSERDQRMLSWPGHDITIRERHKGRPFELTFDGDRIEIET